MPLSRSFIAITTASTVGVSPPECADSGGGLAWPCGVPGCRLLTPAMNLLMRSVLAKDSAISGSIAPLQNSHVTKPFDVEICQGATNLSPRKISVIVVLDRSALAISCAAV